MLGDSSALQLVLSADPALLAIVRLSLWVSLAAVVCAALAGLPLGALIALTRFPGREAAIVVLNALMGLPPVVVGLAVYLLLSRSGPLGSWGLLFTPTAMIVAQTILVTPIIAALARQTIEDLWVEYRDELAKHRAAAIQGWLVLCYTTDDITGKTKGIPALVETAAVYRSRPTIGPDGILPHVVAWEAAGRALAALIDSEAVPADRVSKCLAAWRGVRSILEAGGGDGPKCSDAANPQKHKRGAI
mgnify:CR=1 FL=1